MKDPVRLGEETERWYTWLVTGHPGSAKTSFAGQFAQDERSCDVIWLAVEGGLLTISDWNFIKPPIIVRPRSNEVEELFWNLASRKPPFENMRTLVIDSGTEFYTKDLEATTLRNLPKTSRSGKQRSGVDDHWLEDRGESGARVARLFRWFRDLPCHVVFTAHPREVFPQDEGGGIRQDQTPVSVTPAFGPALLRHVAGYSDFCWFFLQTGPSVRVLTRTKGPFFAKTRGDGLANRLGQVFEWPNGENLVTPLLDVLDGKAERLPDWAYPDGVITAVPETSAESKMEETETQETKTKESK